MAASLVNLVSRLGSSAPLATALFVTAWLPRLGLGQTELSWAKPEGPVPAWLTADADHCARLSEVRRALTKKVSYDFEGVPLQEALRIISRQLQVPIVINARELDDRGHSVDEPVTGRGRDVRFGAVTEQLLKPLDLTFRVHESDIEVTSADDAERNQTAIVYDLAFKCTEPAQVEGLIHVIAKNIEPDLWRDFGGTGDSCITPFGSALVISTNDEAHTKIVDLLSSLTKVAIPARPSIDKYSSRSFDGLQPGKLTLPAGRNYTLIRMIPVEDSSPTTPSTTAPVAAQADRNVQKFEQSPAPDWLFNHTATEEEALRAKLRKPVSVEIPEDTTLDVALKKLLGEAKVDFWIDAVELDDVGKSKDEPVSLSLSNTSLYSALDRLLSPLDLSYRMDGARLEITSTDDAESNLSRRIYDLAYLSEKPLDFTSLMMVISQSVSPEQWAEFGGTGDAVMTAFGSQLIIAAPEATLFQLDVLFYQLSHIKPANLPLSSSKQRYMQVSVQNIPGGSTVDIPTAGQFQLLPGP